MDSNASDPGPFVYLCGIVLVNTVEAFLCPVNRDLYHKSHIVCACVCVCKEERALPICIPEVMGGGHFQNTLKIIYSFIIRKKNMSFMLAHFVQL